MKTTRPNFLVIMVDEWRYPPCYENEELKLWQEKNLRGQKLLKKHGMEFQRHYAGSTACSPSRATIFTAQYPSLHGVSQTSGIAKTAFDPDVFWLDPNTVPTMGDYFSQAGYLTFYKGKWHVSDADIIFPGTTDSFSSYNLGTGLPNAKNTEIYLAAKRLKDYGFDGWVGPEPHGANPYNTGSSAPTGIGGRDIIYTNEVIDLICKLDQSRDKKPWLLVASLVNPHDITLHGDYTNDLKLYDFEVDPTVPIIPPPPTASENLSTKPKCQESYKNVLPKALQPIEQTAEKHRRLYYSLEKKVDDMVYQILKTLINSNMYQDTIVIFTSDHGDLLGAHDGLQQKWHNIYEESIHVPLIFHNPILFPHYCSSDKLTSHIDLIPTMATLAKMDLEKIQSYLKLNHTAVYPLPGKDISLTCPNLDDDPDNFDDKPDVLYFMTGDEPTSGPNQTNPFTNKPYHAVIQPNNIEAIITYLVSKSGKSLYKYARYFDPNQQTDDQYEMYNVTADPLERQNLANPLYATPATNKIRKQLEKLLIIERHKKMLKENPHNNKIVSPRANPDSQLPLPGE